MGSPLVNVGSDIIQAYLQGKAQRAQQEQALAQQQLAEQSLQQRQKEHQDQVKQQEKLLKQRSDEAQLRNEIDQPRLAQMKMQIDEEAKARGLQHKIALAQLRRQSVDAFNSGDAKFPTHMETAPDSSLEEEVRDEEYNPYPGLEGFNPIKRSEVYDKPLNVQQREAEMEARMQLGREQMISRELMNEQTNATRAYLGEMANQMRLQVAAMSGNKGLNRAALNGINGIIKSHDTSRLTKEYQKFKEAVDYLDRRTENPDAPDVNDTTLVYQWIRSQDESAVKEGEYKMASRVGISKAAWLAMQAKRLITPGQFLSDAARAAIEKDMRTRFQVREAAYNRAALGAYEKAKQWDPDLTFEEFNLRLQSGAQIPEQFMNPGSGMPSTGQSQMRPQTGPVNIPGLVGAEDSGRRRK